MDKNTIKYLINRLRPVSIDKPLIRFGPAGDGGYLIPDDIDGISACYSPGVGNIQGFERDCVARGMSVFLADASVSISDSDFHFTKKFIGGVTSGDMITLDDWVIADGTDLMLQMDIEGHEYEAIQAASVSLINRFRIIVIEFHELDQMWDFNFFTKAYFVFEKLLLNHTCVHAHPNNCCGSVAREGLEIPKIMEFTFLRNDRFNRIGYASKFPHDLDYNNTSNQPLPLPDCWWRNQ